MFIIQKKQCLWTLKKHAWLFQTSKGPVNPVIKQLSHDSIIFGVLQAYVEAENMRLESEPCQFSANEIIINVEYKYCPNLTIIDTPGLIAPAPGRKNRELQVNYQMGETLFPWFSFLNCDCGHDSF